LREVERLQREKVHDRKTFLARASCTDPEAHVMRNGEGGTVPRYNLQLVTDTTHGLVVNVEATTDAIDYRQLEPALQRCEQRLELQPHQLIRRWRLHQSCVGAGGSRTWRGFLRFLAKRSAAFVSSAFPLPRGSNAAP
jgi:hypothetical protein